MLAKLAGGQWPPLHIQQVKKGSLKQRFNEPFYFIFYSTMRKRTLRSHSPLRR